MSDIKRLLEAIDKVQYAGEKVGQKPGDQWRGDDPNPPGKKLVGEKNVFKELDNHVKENAVERRLKAQLAEFKQPVVEGQMSIGQQMARDGITYSPDREREIIGQIGDYMKKNGYSEKQIRYYMSYDEDFIPDVLSDLPRAKQGVAESEYGIPDETPGHLPGGPKMTFGEFKKMWPGVILKRPSGGSLAGSVVADVEGWMNNPKSVWEPLKSMSEGEKIGGKYDPEEFDAMVSRLGQKAKQGPMKTVWDPVKRVYKNVPVNQNKQPVKEYGNAQDPDDQSTTPGAAGSAQQDQEDDMGAKLGAQATNQSINALKAIEPNLNPTLAKQALAKGDMPTTMSSAETGQAKELSDLLGTALGNPQTSSQVTALLRKAAQLKGK